MASQFNPPHERVMGRPMDRAVPSYPSDLTDAEWEAVCRHIPASRPIGADRRTSMRSVVNAIFYRRRSGCPWRMLPHDFPHWRTVYGYFRRWQQDGTWTKIEADYHRVRCALRRLGPPPLDVPSYSHAPPPTC
jgi:transposase